MGRSQAANSWWPAAVFRVGDFHDTDAGGGLQTAAAPDGSPAVLAGNVTQDGEQSLIEHSRRLSRQSPLLRSYKRAMVGGILTGEPERPHFDEGVPEVVAKAVGDLWLAVHNCDLERAALHRLIVDGDVLLLDDGTLVPSDQFTATESGPE